MGITNDEFNKIAPHITKIAKLKVVLKHSRTLTPELRAAFKDELARLQGIIDKGARASFD